MKTKILMTTLGILLILAGFASAHAGDQVYWHHMMGWMMGPNGSAMWIFGWLFMILILIGLVLLIIWLIKQIQKK